MNIASNQVAALAQQANALAHAVAQQFPCGSPVDVRFRDEQQQPTPATVTGHRVTVEATSDGANEVRVLLGVKYEPKRRGVGGARFVDIARVQLQHPDGSDHTTA